MYGELLSFQYGLVPEGDLKPKRLEYPVSPVPLQSVNVKTAAPAAFCVATRSLPALTVPPSVRYSLACPSGWKVNPLPEAAAIQTLAVPAPPPDSMYGPPDAATGRRYEPPVGVPLVAVFCGTM